MAGLVPAIHVFQHYFMKVAMFYIRPSVASSVRQIILSARTSYEDVDGRDKPGHDEELRK